jgi:predicted ArsR family transcriptional regulator
MISDTKRKILDLLEVNGGLTTSQLGKMLDLSTTTVRRHLAMLEEQAMLVRYTDQRGTGRPSFVFELKNGGLRKTRERRKIFLDSLFMRVVDLARQGRRGILSALRQDEQHQHLIAQCQGETLSERIRLLAALFDHAGRLTTWQQANEGSYVMREHNCPFRHSAVRLKQPCRYEKALLQEALQAQVDRVSCIVGGDVVCAYLIHEGRKD